MTERAMGVALPPDVRLLYRLHNGQNQRGPASATPRDRVSRGLFGGFLVYDHLRAMWWTSVQVRRCRLVVVAAAMGTEGTVTPRGWCDGAA